MTMLQREKLLPLMESECMLRYSKVKDRGE
ncbi:hypothetical protein M622_12930 [Thauera terpenica 58Eu]|uniref:Uncharacterized protein n=1 Tax=Thauera terpenica 58Eu TaxID=1348657 RepID=S9ZSE5_9RHOO|nr:hypothetical protein M622_12930 [Thauera terpenica 58Eu]